MFTKESLGRKRSAMFVLFAVIGILLSGRVLDIPAKAAEAPQNTEAKASQSETEAFQAKLRDSLKAADRFAEAKYSFASWNALRFAMNAARSVADNTKATPAELQTALADVQQKIIGLQERPTLPDQSPRISLSASLFATNRKGSFNNVTLLWATADPQDRFELFRASGKSANFSKIYSGQGTSFNDYSLRSDTYSYKLVAHRGAQALSSRVERVTTTPMLVNLSDYSNQTGSVSTLLEPLKVGDTFYRFDGTRDGKTVRYTVKTSSDGKNWKEGPVILDSSSHSDLDDFKFEAGTIFYDKKHDRIVWWCHWERSGPRYGDGRAFVATAKPGQRFTVHHIYNPLGVQVRDMSVFRDDDGQGYLVAASNLPGQGANATLYLFKMNADYTDVTGITSKIMEGGYREAPHIIHTAGWYYFFFSQAAGWFPSRAGYVSARALDGRWSQVRYIGSSSTFSAQSGAIIDYGEDSHFTPFLAANRWIRGEGTSSNVVIPLHCAEGFVFGDYAPTLLVDRAKAMMLPLTEGRLLSQDQPVTASISGSKDHEASKAFDGDYTTSFQSDERKWPFSVMTDLGTACRVRNVQISWHLHKGSEAYYKYTIEGSRDGREWRMLLDRTDDAESRVSKTYGFTSDLLSVMPAVRYLRINVKEAVLHNNPNNWYLPTLYEVKIYGDKG